MTYTINENPEFNSREVYFDGKPSEAVRSALKSIKCRWHSVKKCWYGRASEAEIRNAIENPGSVAAEQKKQTKKSTAASVENALGVKVGDIFSASWGYDQTNNDFFQVVELVGTQSVRVREVCLHVCDRSAISSMAEDIIYKNTRELMPAVSSSVFINDQEKGDLKRVQPGFCSDPEEAKKHCRIKISSFCDAYKENGDYIKVYESSYA